MDPDLKFIQIFATPGKYFRLTFLLSWILWMPLVMLRLGVGSLQLSETAYTLLSFLGVLMPAVAALVLTARDGETRFLLARLTLWRIGWKWWAAAVLLQPGLLILASLIYALLYGKSPVALIQHPAAGALVVNILFSIAGDSGRGSRLARRRASGPRAEAQCPTGQPDPGDHLRGLAHALLADRR
jgi:hypothetical protein